MGKREQYRSQLTPLMIPGHAQQLARFLLENSNLPGPRGNLELAAEFAAAYATDAVESQSWALVQDWANSGMQAVPTHSAQEFLPFCAVQAMGAHYPHASAERRAWIKQSLRRLANSQLWRVREAVAIALQLMAEHDFKMAVDVMQFWMDHEPSLLEARATVAGLAHPPILSDAAQAATALSLAMQAIDMLRQTSDRRQEGFRVLRKALEYALSVIVVADPGPGFHAMQQLAADNDPDVARVVRENLKKKRLQPYSAKTAAVQSIISGV